MTWDYLINSLKHPKFIYWDNTILHALFHVLEVSLRKSQKSPSLTVSSTIVRTITSQTWLWGCKVKQAFVYLHPQRWCSFWGGFTLPSMQRWSGVMAEGRKPLSLPDLLTWFWELIYCQLPKNTCPCHHCKFMFNFIVCNVYPLKTTRVTWKLILLLKMLDNIRTLRIFSAPSLG
jgi:hypothetical protein